MVEQNRYSKRRRLGNLGRAVAVLAAALILAAAAFLADSWKGGPTSDAAVHVCPLGARLTGAPITMSEPACPVIASDTGANPDYESFWGEIQCAEPDRYHWSATAGDQHRTATGRPQGNDAYRRVTVLDGDDFYGERCELGEDDWKEGPTAFYRQGDHCLTYISERLPDNFPLGTDTWQTVMQMKQTQPSDGGGGAPRIEMEAREHRWVIDVDWHELWSFPARRNFWTRFAWDVYYSRIPGHGLLQVSVDLNGDGDFDDPGERSPTFHVATLKTEVEGPNVASDGIAAGEPIPGRLRAGIYHNPAIHCPAPKGCSVEIDNVQLLGRGTE